MKKLVLSCTVLAVLALAIAALSPLPELSSTTTVEAAEKGILICFPWEDVACNVEGRCSNECVDKVLRVRACQVCTSTGCTFSHYERSCSELFCS